MPLKDLVESMFIMILLSIHWVNKQSMIICFIRFSWIGKQKGKEILQYLPEENTQGKTERNEKDSN